MLQNDTFHSLKITLEGDIFTDNVQRILYATDASSYREIPRAVCRPRSAADICAVIAFARENKTSVIPRAGGTSLAGQVVGPGIVVDVSKYMNKIIDFNALEKWVIVEPGVNLSVLNRFLAPHGLQYGPETSTANRCCIGGMVGNNSCGLHSLIYGSARDHILEADCIMADGSRITFGELSTPEFHDKCEGNPELVETKIYRNIRETLSDPVNRHHIRKEFPDPTVRRRNNGYAIDMLLDTDPFTGNGVKFNMCKLLAGSEGTLAFAVGLKLNLIPLPPKHKALVCAHFANLNEAYRGNLVALRYNPGAIELMDDIIMECTLENIEQRKNRFFIAGSPKAMLMVEFARETPEELEKTTVAMIEELRAAGLGYHYPVVKGEADINKVWALRTAGLGVLSNIAGDKKSVTVIEDTAVAPEAIPDYMAELDTLLEHHGLSCVKYAHIATGELHLRPLLDLKDESDIELYHTIAKDVAALVKKYRGSLSGEHGDGRLRGEFIPFMLGNHNYNLIKQLKKTWDPENIMNPGKITDTPPITESLRYLVGKSRELETVFDFSEQQGFLRAIEKCNGSGDCRKSVVTGGLMCPTYMVTTDEDKSTRGRANVLREFLTRAAKPDPFEGREIYDILDLCISCKACKAECPSNVDMTKLKAEFLQRWHDIHGIPGRSLMIAFMPQLYKWGRLARPAANMIIKSALFKKTAGIAHEREIPRLASHTLRQWFRKYRPLQTPLWEGRETGVREVFLFADEFTNENDSHIGIKAVKLLNRLGYQVHIPPHRESGRTFLSKGMLRKAKEIASHNVATLSEIITTDAPLIGLEPSAILTFRDEYPELVNKELRNKASRLAANTFMFEEFMVSEVDNGNISRSSFTTTARHIKLHGHCQQKAVASTMPTRKMLEIPAGYTVDEIAGGCCGMAGSFGYEKEHYALSMQIGEMRLFPEVRKAGDEVIVVAPGTSCRHHIREGTGRTALHPVEALYDALAWP